MNNPPLTVTLDPVLLDRLETFVRTHAEYMKLSRDAFLGAEGRALAGQGAQAAIAVTHSLLQALPATELGTLGEALAALGPYAPR